MKPNQLKLYVTPEQHKAIAVACAEADMKQSDFVREAIAAACAANGVRWPDNLRPVGNHSPNPRRRRKTT